MSEPTRRPINDLEAQKAISARQAEINQICTFAFGGAEAVEATRQALQIAARYRLGAAGYLRGKARVVAFQAQTNAADSLLSFLKGLDATDLAEVMLPAHDMQQAGSPDPEQLAATRFGQQPLRLTAWEDATTLIMLLERARAGLRRSLHTASPLEVGHPGRSDCVAFQVESLHAIWKRFGQGKPATQGTGRAAFAGFVAACEELVAKATGMPLKPTTVHNAVVAYLQGQRAGGTPPG